MNKSWGSRNGEQQISRRKVFFSQWILLYIFQIDIQCINDEENLWNKSIGVLNGDGWCAY